jgi:phosphate transport system substrate-binding protein
MDRSKRNRRGMLLGAVAVAGVAIAVAGCGSSSSSSSSGTATGSSGASSTGSGSSFAALTYNTWCQNSKLCSYTSKGSAGGIQDFINGVVSWGATDSPLKPAELQQLATARGGVLPVYFPTFLGAIAVPTNVTGVKTLQFSGPTLAGIFDGAITTWNDPKIAADNPGVTLPSNTITVCVRSDGSGTSSNFSGYLGTESAQFLAKVGPASKTPPWTAPHIVQGLKNPGVLQCVKDNANSIGYADLADAISAGDQGILAKIKGPSGAYVAPTQSSVTAAGTTAKASNPIVPKDLQKSLINSSASGAYPITITTFVLGYSDYQKAGEAAKLPGVQAFLNYAYGSTAQGALNGIGNAPLPSTILSAAKAQLANLH